MINIREKKKYTKYFTRERMNNDNKITWDLNYRFRLATENTINSVI